MEKDKTIPKHIAIIMDGNRRWAKERGIPTLEGHRKGYNNIKKISKLCVEKGIKYLTVWAFSTENWNRSKKEINYLFKLLRFAMVDAMSLLEKNNIKLNVLGRISDLPKALQDAIQKAEEKTKNYKKGVLNIAMNYGGRAEIIDMVKKINDQQIKTEDINEELIINNLYFKDIPDPDLVIRTSGEQRLSGYLPWQSTYSELYFCQAYWPDFDEKEFDQAIKEFQIRKRNFGK